MTADVAKRHGEMFQKAIYSNAGGRGGGGGTPDEKENSARDAGERVVGRAVFSPPRWPGRDGDNNNGKRKTAFSHKAKFLFSRPNNGEKTERIMWKLFFSREIISSGPNLFISTMPDDVVGPFR
ncbi:hypothetical protein GWI33_014406 [Rhynchophorus ferrugineus]|uniref:Uncharacterized protein n=1 Tax=Rhynchophorus ferrugineus TaxID=354439 RepID=A0A834I557_RHYFE|nr:hypothetical protein GWI33_014406 [Rhynchophorus ferrugineus]